MLVLLPDEDSSLEALEAGMNAASVAEWSAGMRPAEVEIFMPKFKQESSYDLSTTLAALGGCERELRSHIQTALNVGVAPERIVATFLHMAPYAGFPRTLNALFTAKEVFELRGVTVAGIEKPKVGEEKK